MPTSQEILLIGYDRYARAYWHWKPLGGIIIEEHEYPTKTENPGSSTAEESQDSSTVNRANHRVIDDYRKPKTKWYYMDDSRQLLLLIRPLNNRGIREKNLRSMLTSIRPMFISSLARFRNWLQRELGSSYVRNKVSPAPEATEATTEDQQLPMGVGLALDDESAAEKVDESQVNVPPETSSDKPEDSPPNETSKKGHNVVEPSLYIQNFKDLIHQQIEQLGALLFSLIKKTQLPEIDLNSTVEEYLEHVKLLFSYVYNINDHSLSRLPVESRKRVRWLRTTNFQEDFDDNIKTFSSLNVNLEMCIKDIQNYGLDEEEIEDDHQETSVTKQDRAVNLRDRKSRNKVAKEDADNSESEDEIAIQRKSTRRTHRYAQDDRANDEDKSRKSPYSENSALPERSRKLRSRRAAQQSNDITTDPEPVTRHENSAVTRQTRKSRLKRSRNEEADDSESSTSRRKLRPR
ncbi:hypothetical protein K493DRAFT_312017, partial [Basidiobolus meristosporus CBS 931.73]